MKKNNFPLYKKQLDALRKSNYAYSKELLAFAKKDPDAPVEDAVLTSGLLIFDAEKFYHESVPLRKRRVSQSTKPRPEYPHPLKAWEDYENALADVLLADGKWLNSTQTFNDGELVVKFNPLPVRTDEIAVVPEEHEERLNPVKSDENSTLSQIIDHEAKARVTAEVEEETNVDVVDNVVTVTVVEEDNTVNVEEDITVSDETDSSTNNINPYAESTSRFTVGKKYVAPESLTVDNSIVDEETKEQGKESHDERVDIFGGNVKGIKTTKEYEAPAESIIDNSIHDEHIAVIIPDSSGFKDPDVNIIHTVDEEINVETDLEIKDKEYVAPDELIVDNSIDVSKIVINPRKEEKRFKGFRNKRKTVDYSSIEETLENGNKEYVRDDKLSDIDYLENPATTDTVEEVTPAKVDERTLAEANEYHVASETDLKLGSKEYIAPDELIVDNSLPKASVIEESEDSIVVETVEKAIVSETDIRIKNKEYVAPDELVVDNSIVEDNVKDKKKRKGLFGRKQKQEEETVVAQPAVFLPQKPIDFELPEATEQAFVYKPKNRITEESIISTLNEVKEESETNNVQDEELVADMDVANEESAVEDETYVKHASDKITFTENIEIDYAALAAELSQEKNETASYGAGYSPKQKASEESNSDDEDNEDDAYSSKLREDRVAKLGFDASAIIKDIKIIDI